MLGLILLGMLGVGASAMIIDDLMDNDTPPAEDTAPQDDTPPDVTEPEVVEPEVTEPEEEDTPSDEEDDLPPDLGASLTFEDGVISIDVGEDETRDLVAMRITNPTDYETYTDENGTLHDDVFIDYTEIHFYLVEDADAFPPHLSDILAENPDIRNFGSDAHPEISREDFKAHLGDRIGTVDLGLVVSPISSDLPTVADTRPEARVETNVAATGWDFWFSESTLVDTHDTQETFYSELDLGQDVASLRGQSFSLDNFNDTERYSGPGDDTVALLDGNENLTFFAEGGHDVVTVDGANNSVDGGAGSDMIALSGTGNSADGGMGDDTITVGQDAVDATVSGGTGDDMITVSAGTFVTETPDIPNGADHITVNIDNADAEPFSASVFAINPEISGLDDEDSVAFNVDIDSFPPGNFHYVIHEHVDVGCEGGCEVTDRSLVLVWTPEDISDLNAAPSFDTTRVLSSVSLGGFSETFDLTGDAPGNNTLADRLVDPEITANVAISSTLRYEFLTGA